MSKTEIISLRLKNEELSALTALPEGLGKTTSEKIRSLIREASKKSHEPSLSSLQERLGPERDQSEVISFYLDWLLSTGKLLEGLEKESKLELANVEKVIIAEILHKVEKFISLGISREPRVINNRYFLDGLLSLNKIIGIVEAYHTKKDS